MQQLTIINLSSHSDLTSSISFYTFDIRRLQKMDIVQGPGKNDTKPQVKECLSFLQVEGNVMEGSVKSATAGADDNFLKFCDQLFRDS